MSKVRCEFCKHGQTPGVCALTGDKTWKMRGNSTLCGPDGALYESNPSKAPEIDRHRRYGVEPTRLLDIEPRVAKIGRPPRALDDAGVPLVLGRGYRDSKYKPGDSQRRHTGGPRHAVPGRGQRGNNYTMSEDHPAAVEGRTRYPRAVGRVQYPPPKSGYLNTKIGKTVTKGAWRGFPIFTLSLEERYTCPSHCANWLDCYGNKMPFNARFRPGPELETEIARQLFSLSRQFPAGFVVRLHVLGDFYSPAYVDKWATWMALFPALRVFGYTAWHPGDLIGAPLDRLRRDEPRFRIRFSNLTEWEEDTTVTIDRAEDAPTRAVVCPAQTGRASCCAVCALCWNSTRQIAFLKH